MTLTERRARLLALELEHAQKKAVNACYRKHYGPTDVFRVIESRHGPQCADDARRALANGRGKVPWMPSEFARLVAAIRDEQWAIERMIAMIGHVPKRETVNGNGWALIDDTERGLTVLRLDTVNITAKLRYALQGERFKRSKEVGYCRERSDRAWTAGLGLGRVIEEGRGERPPDTTEATDTAK